MRVKIICLIAERYLLHRHFPLPWPNAAFALLGWLGLALVALPPFMLRALAASSGLAIMGNLLIFSVFRCLLTLPVVCIGPSSIQSTGQCFG